MKISYKWLSEYLPVSVEPERLSRILTSVGLEVEDYYRYEESKGGLEGLIIGKILTCEKHPNADKLSITTVDVGSGEILQIVCGAPNVAVGQNVIVAKVGTTIYPVNSNPVTMKAAKIRGRESQGMICAEDEIGLGSGHQGIIVLNDVVSPGTSAADYYQIYSDWVFEIGLTPNRMEAMSHWGVARDVCAYLAHHDQKGLTIRTPVTNGFKADTKTLPVIVTVENTKSCRRYSGVSIANITIGESPIWMRQRLKAIGLRPINNIVDITNYIQHETGQPLHAFDFDHLKGKHIIVKNLKDGTEFIALDEKPRKLSDEDLMICDEEEGVCIAGVFGGARSGVSAITKNIFLESAWFNPIDIRKTSFRHNLRTDAASRFEKGTDISNTVTVLQRAALMIRELCGGEIASEIVDIYPAPLPKVQVALKYNYLKKLSGKNYHPDAVKEILVSLGFAILKESLEEVIVSVPYHKPDISLPADIVEEIVRIDGLDNIQIPSLVTITPSVAREYVNETIREKVANYLVGLGISEIMTNSITNLAYFDELELVESVRMLNSLSAELNIMRPSMLETGLESIAYNLNRKNNNLKFFDFGKTYSTTGAGEYHETEHLCIYVTGNISDESWRIKTNKTDIYFLKGIVNTLLTLLDIKGVCPERFTHKKLSPAIQMLFNNKAVVQMGSVHSQVLARFNIKQPVFFADIDWIAATKDASSAQIKIEEVPRFPDVQRDLAMIVPARVQYEEAERAIHQLRLPQLRRVRLFDLFESDKLGAGKKSMAINFTFLDTERTLTDKEIDDAMTKIMSTLEQYLEASIRK